jgi:hypothetical protein
MESFVEHPFDIKKLKSDKRKLKQNLKKFQPNKKLKKINKNKSINAKFKK